MSKPAYLWSEEEDKVRDDSVLELKVDCVNEGLFVRSLLDSLEELLLLLS